jgi:sugar phosphate isomerase/epimerase
MTMTRRTALATVAAGLARAATRLPANKNVKWALGANLWNSFPRVPFTDILDVMRDTGFIGIRLTQFPQILKTYDITAAQMRAECEKRGCHVITISFNGPTHDPARHKDVLASAKTAMTFLKDFDANHLVVFPPNRTNLTDAGFKAMCDCFNQIGSLANDMGFRAGLHNHMNEMVQTAEEIDRCMAMTDPKLFHFSPDIAHLYLADCDVPKTLDKHKSRLMLLDYKDARHVTGKITDDVFDFGDGAIDFPACHRVLKSVNFKGWLCADLDVARKGPRASYEHCAQYVVNTLEPIYA